jgi:type II secretion system protein H
MTLPPPNSFRRSGFTLMELMVVLVLIGVMTAMILPELRGTHEAALLHSTARELANACGIAYSRAVAVQQPHRLRLDKTTHHYAVEKRARNTRGNAFAPVRDLPGGEGTLDMRIAIEFRRPADDSTTPVESDAQPVSMIDAAFPAEGEGIVFYADGTADAREIQLRDRDGFRLAIRINPTTARVQIRELERQ